MVRTGRTIEIWASDVSPAALEQAARGVYRERSFRALPAALQGEVFHDRRGRLAGRSRACTPVSASDEPTCSIPTKRRCSDSARYIFCRNVFIYFSPAGIAQVVAGFAKTMLRPDYLFVGVSESLLRLKYGVRVGAGRRGVRVHASREQGPMKSLRRVASSVTERHPWAASCGF